MRKALHYRETTLWQKAMEATKELYRLVPRLPREETYGMRSQITRASVSVPANIAEGWTRETSRDQANFLAIAQGSLAETETLLTLCEDLGWFPKSETERLFLDGRSEPDVDHYAPQTPSDITTHPSLTPAAAPLTPHSSSLTPRAKRPSHSSLLFTHS